jgi:hypothetical protein
MKSSRRRFLALTSLALVIGLTIAAASLPTRLGDQDFWRLSKESSEPDGVFRSDNLLSNELGLQLVVPELVRSTKRGRVYLGVGPEQNFTYIAATKPAMAFIIDIRRGNLDLHLMYKALFELSANRAEFVSRLFSRRKPEGLNGKSTIAEIFDAVSNAPNDPALFNQNLQAIDNLLLKKHGFALSDDDVEGIKYVYSAFFLYGPKIRYSSTSGFGGGVQPTYSDLMRAVDKEGVERGYLATEEDFRFIKELETRNLVVPIVGNFGGPKAIRAVGKYLKEKDAIVSAFYLSNVEQYLRQDSLWNSFCGNVAALPLDESSTFIRSVRRGANTALGFGLSSQLGNMAAEVKDCHS